jgi:hypothetical protein
MIAEACVADPKASDSTETTSFTSSVAFMLHVLRGYNGSGQGSIM